MIRRVALGAVLPLFLLAAWEGLWHVPGMRLISLSHPAAVAQALGQGLADGSLLRASAETLQAALAGFAMAALAGLALGVLMGLAPRVNRIVSPTIDALRPVPAVALMPLALMVFGFGAGMEASVVAFACVWPVLLVTTAAVRQIDPRLLEVAQVLEMPLPERAFKVVLPAAIGQIAVGLRLALAMALVVAVTVEIVLNPRGLGHALMGAQQAQRFDSMFAQLLWLGALGVAVNALSVRMLRGPGLRQAST